MDISILGAARDFDEDFDLPCEKKIVVPGEEMGVAEGFMSGHGTHVVNGVLCASISGVVETVEKLVFVRPLKCRYRGEVGDVVVGRVQEIAAGRWFVDLGASQRGQLMLTAINLPGSEQRRRTDDELLDMQKYFCEDDLISMEVQRIMNDGAIMLHTRSAKYGKLENGCCIQIPSSTVRKQQSHITTLKNGVHIILGSNGFVWIGIPPKTSQLDTLNFAQRDQAYVAVDDEMRKTICCVRNCIHILGSKYFGVSVKSIEDLCDISLNICSDTSKMLLPKMSNLILSEYIKSRMQEKDM